MPELRPLLLTSSLLLMSCRSEAVEAPPPAPSAPEPVAAEEALPEPQEIVYIYDAKGALIPSDDRNGP